MGEELVEHKPFIHTLFFWTAGISSLFVFNCILSLLFWFADRFDSRAFNQIGFYFNAGSFVAFLFYDKIMSVLHFKRAIILIPILLVTDSVVIYCIAEYIEHSTAKYYYLLPNIVFCGFVNSILQTSLIKYSFEFTYIEITNYNSGTALVGILTNVIALINVYALPNTEDLRTQAAIYLGFQIITLCLIIMIFAQYIRVCLAPKLRKEAESIASMDKVLIDTVTIGDSPSTVSDRLLTPTPSLLSTLKIIAPYFFNMVLVYAITLGVFPGYCFALGMSDVFGKNVGAANVTILLVYNIGDFVGKWVYGKFSLRDNIVPHLYSMARVGFIVFILYALVGDGQPSLMNNSFITVSYVLLCAITNGYITSALFSLSSERVANEHKANSGFLMTLGLLFGLTYGTLSITLGATFTQ